MKLSIRHKGILLVAVPLLAELVLLLVLGVLLLDADKTAKRIDHYRSIIANTTAMQKQCLDAGNALIIYTITHKAPLLTRYSHVAAEIEAGLSDLTDAADKDKKHRSAMLQVCALGNEGIEALDQMREGVNDPGWLGSITRTKLPDQLLQITNGFFAASSDLVEELRRTEPLSPEMTERSVRLEFFCITVAVSICILFIVLSILFYRQITSKLVVLMDNTHRFADGQQLHPVLEGTDEISALDQVFHKMSATIEESAEFKKQVVATVSHELRTPLTSLHSFLTLLADGSFGKIPEDAETRSRLAKEQIDRLIRLLNDLLAADSIRAKGFEIRISRVDIANVVEQSINAVSYVSKRKQIKVRNEVESLNLDADGDRILQVLVNLISNAVKFSNKGQEIIIRSEKSEEHVRIDTIDTGRGVPAEMQEEIFNRHAQVSSSDKEKQGGMGLGLAISKAIILQHGGKIGCRNNEEGQGSIFWFTLPLKQASSLSDAVETVNPELRKESHEEIKDNSKDSG